MARTTTYKGHTCSIRYAKDDERPVTSVRVTLRKPLPAGVAIYPSDATPWSSGRISSRVVATGDGSFDSRFDVRADRPADLNFLGPEVRAALCAAHDQHLGLWVGHQALVCVESGHVRDNSLLMGLLDELVRLAELVAASVEASSPAHRPDAGAARTAEAARPGTVKGEPVAPGAATTQAGDLDAFIRACFDRRVASYEVNRRLKQEWLGRTIRGQGRLVQGMPLGGHDFDFADLKGHRFDVQVAGPEDLAPLVRVRLQVEPSGRAALDPPSPGQMVRFEGRLVDANPLLFVVQLVSADLTASQ